MQKKRDDLSAYDEAAVSPSLLPTLPVLSRKDERAESTFSLSRYHKPLCHVSVSSLLLVSFSWKITFEILNKTTHISCDIMTLMDKRFTRKKGACKTLDKVKVLVHCTVLLLITG